ncbi:hypothetical protein BDN72DRAFT_862879 [Pluteus cervinus]|uniref:Uncharacterized protein n=1 Tax=Pluteus cervinus TaxID=181527 RepID=A0ACD3A9S9_9AGAR|nr:hypothetical protein BDN72DRAFT_862879 [Pluteus cervinus]
MSWIWLSKRVRIYQRRQAEDELSVMADLLNPCSKGQKKKCGPGSKTVQVVTTFHLVRDMIKTSRRRRLNERNEERRPCSEGMIYYRDGTFLVEDILVIANIRDRPKLTTKSHPPAVESGEASKCTGQPTRRRIEREVHIAINSRLWSTFPEDVTGWAWKNEPKNRS